jgi:hypothetical protein
MEGHMRKRRNLGIFDGGAQFRGIECIRCIRCRARSYDWGKSIEPGE